MRLALAHPQINFQYINDGKTIYNLKPIGYKEEALQFDHFSDREFSEKITFLCWRIIKYFDLRMAITTVHRRGTQ